MKLTDYQDKAEVFAAYDEDQGIVYTALGLTSEAGEYAGKVKRIIRGDSIDPSELEDEMVKELGDVLWYVAQAATELGVSLDYVAEENLRKLEDRQARGVIKDQGDNR